MSKKTVEEEWTTVDSSFPNVWKAEEQDETLQGVLVRIRHGKFGEVYVVKTDDDETYCLPNHKQLTSLIELANLHLGYRILITCVHVGSSKRNDYYKYELKYRPGKLPPTDDDIPF